MQGMEENPYQSPGTPGARRSLVSVRSFWITVAVIGLLGAVLLPILRMPPRQPSYSRFGPESLEAREPAEDPPSP